MLRAPLPLLLLLAAIPLTVYVAVVKAPIPGDVELARATQTVGGLELLAEAVNWAGDLRWIPAAAFYGVWLARSEPGTRRGVVWSGVALLVLQGGSQVLKIVVDSPRPSPEYGIAVDRARASGGFPSGHVYGDVLTYGALIVFAPAVAGRWSPPIQAASAAVILLAGWARVYVGAHWPSDVIGGYLWGAVALAAVVAVSRRSLLPRAGATMAAELRHRRCEGLQAGDPRPNERQESDSR